MIRFLYRTTISIIHVLFLFQILKRMKAKTQKWRAKTPWTTRTRQVHRSMWTTSSFSSNSSNSNSSRMRIQLRINHTLNTLRIILNKTKRMPTTTPAIRPTDRSGCTSCALNTSNARLTVNPCTIQPSNNSSASPFPSLPTLDLSAHLN